MDVLLDLSSTGARQWAATNTNSVVDSTFSATVEVVGYDVGGLVALPGAPGCGSTGGGTVESLRATLALAIEKQGGIVRSVTCVQPPYSQLHLGAAGGSSSGMSKVRGWASCMVK